MVQYTVIQKLSYSKALQPPHPQSPVFLNFHASYVKWKLFVTRRPVGGTVPIFLWDKRSSKTVPENRYFLFGAYKNR